MPAMTAEEWRNGTNEQLERINLQPEGMKPRMAGAVAGMAPGAGFIKIDQAASRRIARCLQFRRHRWR